METRTAIKIERLHFLDGEGPTKAFCDLLIMDSYVVKGLRILRGKEGLFLGMPRERGRDGKWYETFFPISADIRKDLQNMILEEYGARVK